MHKAVFSGKYLIRRPMLWYIESKRTVEMLTESDEIELAINKCHIFYKM